MRDMTTSHHTQPNCPPVSLALLTLSQFGVGFKLLFFLVIIVICIQSTGSGRVAELLER